MACPFVTVEQVELPTVAKRASAWRPEDDWHRIWPELIGTEGAPVVPAAQEAAETSDAG